MTTILLTGATGKVSSATIHALQGRGHRLVGLVRDPAKAAELAALGVELRTGDLEKPRSLEQGAFAGVDVAWVLTPPGPLASYQSSNAVWAARQAGVKHIVRMSAVGAAHDAPTVNSRSHALSDAELERSGIPFTILKPHFFMQNLMMGAQTIVEQGMLYMPFAAAKLPMIDSRDIGAVAAEILSNPSAHAGKTYTLTGPAAISLDQAASAIGEAVGKTVKYVPIPVEAFVEQLVKYGADDFTQTALRDYFTAYSRGWQDAVTPFTKQITGKDARSFGEFARDHAAAFGKR